MPKGRIKHIDESARPHRVPLFDQPRNILTVEGKDDKFHYHWMHDKDNRIEKAIRGGYVIVTYGDLKIGERTVNTKKVDLHTPVTQKSGDTVVLNLMRIPLEFYNEDQANKMGMLQEKEMQMVSDSEALGLKGSIKIERN